MYLGDYLGQLLSEISMARMQADLETVRLAELYATHPLLRTMPVPHVRLPDVEMEIPVLIKASEEPRAGESARGGATLADMSRKFDEVLAAHLSKAGMALSAADRKKLRAALDERLTQTGVPTEISVDVNRVADDLTSTALRVVGELRPKSTAEPAIVTPIGAEFREAVRLEFLKLRTPPPRLTVLVTSAEIREAGTTENLTRLRLKVSEQGVEWTTIESEGVRHDRLVPE
ncbi:MAG: hypothetical protein HY699_14430 [Deltaproteobacteria bacterium]|nr:hypothetical protein [Deltaproteobacteria bacterium]